MVAATITEVVLSLGKKKQLLSRQNSHFAKPCTMLEKTSHLNFNHDLTFHFTTIPCELIGLIGLVKHHTKWPLNNAGFYDCDYIFAFSR